MPLLAHPSTFWPLSSSSSSHSSLLQANPLPLAILFYCIYVRFLLFNMLFVLPSFVIHPNHSLPNSLSLFSPFVLLHLLTSSTFFLPRFSWLALMRHRSADCFIVTAVSNYAKGKCSGSYLKIYIKHNPASVQVLSWMRCISSCLCE